MKKFRSIMSLENPVRGLVYALMAREEIVRARKCNFHRRRGMFRRLMAAAAGAGAIFINSGSLAAPRPSGSPNDAGPMSKVFTS